MLYTLLLAILLLILAVTAFHFLYRRSPDAPDQTDRYSCHRCGEHSCDGRRSSGPS
jgi:hypothetical protein